MLCIIIVISYLFAKASSKKWFINISQVERVKQGKRLSILLKCPKYILQGAVPVYKKRNSVTYTRWKKYTIVG
jgi:hypothetical protein